MSAQNKLNNSEESFLTPNEQLESENNILKLLNVLEEIYESI